MDDYLDEILFYNQIAKKVFEQTHGSFNSEEIKQRKLERITDKFLASLFELNDATTRTSFANACISYLNEVQSKRGVLDYLVVCDESNNTPARIDRNELWVDVAVEPVKAAEFIYIPVRILNTGALSAA